MTSYQSLYRRLAYAPGPLKLTGKRSAVTSLGEVKAFYAALGPLSASGILDQPEGASARRKMLRNLAKWKTSMAGLLANAELRDPDRLGLIDDEGSRTFTELNDDTHSLALALRERGICGSSTVAVMCRNGRGILYPLFAKALLGYRVALLNAWGSGAQLHDIIEREKANALVIDAEFVDLIDRDQIEEMGITVVVAAPQSLPEDAAPSDSWLWLRDLVAEHTGERITRPPKKMQDTIVMTSGTHGTPKGVVLREPKTPKSPGPLLKTTGWRRHMVIQLTASIFHAWGWLHANLCIATRSTMVVRRIFDPEQAYDDILRYQVSGIISAAVFLAKLEDVAQKRDPDKTQMPKIEFVATSGNAISPDLVAKLADRFGPVICNFYGSTEHGQVAMVGGQELLDHPTMAGRTPIGAITKIFDKNGKECGPNERGRVYSINGMTFSGYTSPKDVPSVREGLLDTGDEGYFDEDGRLFLMGRADDMAIIGGENVFPRTVEETIGRLPEVSEVYVTKRDDPETIQALVAYVVLREPLDPDKAGAAAERIKDYVRDNLASHSVPREVHFRNSLPRNDTGKVVPRLL